MKRIKADMSHDDPCIKSTYLLLLVSYHLSLVVVATIVLRAIFFESLK